MYHLNFAIPLETRCTHEYLIWKCPDVAAELAQTDQQTCTNSDVHSVQEEDNEHMSTASCPAKLKTGQLSEGQCGRCWAKCRKPSRKVQGALNEALAGQLHQGALGLASSRLCLKLHRLPCGHLMLYSACGLLHFLALGQQGQIGHYGVHNQRHGACTHDRALSR